MHALDIPVKPINRCTRSNHIDKCVDGMVHGFTPLSNRLQASKLFDGTLHLFSPAEARLAVTF